MAKFWEMAVAFFAMMSMVVVPVSCGDDDDDKGGSSNGLGGKIYDLRPDHSISYSDIYHEEELKIIRFFNNGNYELYEPYCIVINYKVDEQNLELRVSKKICKSTTTPGLKEAEEKLRISNMDEKEKKEYFAHVDAIMSQNDTIETYKAEGRAEGERETNIRNAKRLKKLGIEFETISKATDLTFEEIKMI